MEGSKKDNKTRVGGLEGVAVGCMCVGWCGRVAMKTFDTSLWLY